MHSTWNTCYWHGALFFPEKLTVYVSSQVLQDASVTCCHTNPLCHVTVIQKWLSSQHFSVSTCYFTFSVKEENLTDMPSTKNEHSASNNASFAMIAEIHTSTLQALITAWSNIPYWRYLQHHELWSKEHLRFSQQGRQRFKTSGMLHCANQ